MNRREFLALGVAAGAGAGALGIRCDKKETVLTSDGKVAQVPSSTCSSCPASKIREGIPGRKWVMVIDLAKCDGCGECSRACSAMHYIPAGREWLRVYQMQDSQNATPYWFPKPCFHCDNPPCTKVCPVDATFKRQDGIVLIDNDRCIGCRFCMAACPYSARVFNWAMPQEPDQAKNEPYSPEKGYPRKIGTVEKCDFCPDMAAQGKLPACITSCPMGALYYGDEIEDAVSNSKGETERFSSLIKDRAGYRFFEELGTKPRVYYLPPKNRLHEPPSKHKRNER